MKKFLVIGVTKEFKTWSISLEDEDGNVAPVESSNWNPTYLSEKLYEDKENGGVVPSQIILVGVEDGVPVVKETFDAGDYN